MSNRDMFYVGGDLFIDSERYMRKKEAEMLRGELGDKLEIYNPMENDDINDKTVDEPIKAEDIYLEDNKRIERAKYISGEIKVNSDDGLMWEMGYAEGLNRMLDLLEMYSVEEIKEMIPKKEILGYCSDIRQDAKDYEGIRIPFGLNQYVVGGLLMRGKLYRHYEDIVKYVKENNK